LRIYLHYVFDLWAERWRRREATGDMIMVRYALPEPYNGAPAARRPWPSPLGRFKPIKTSYRGCEERILWSMLQRSRVHHSVAMIAW
jgi:hypothetical protein